MQCQSSKSAQVASIFENPAMVQLVNACYRTNNLKKAETTDYDSPTTGQCFDRSIFVYCICLLSVIVDEPPQWNSLVLTKTATTILESGLVFINYFQLPLASSDVESTQRSMPVKLS